VHDHDEGDPGAVGQSSEKFLQCLYATGGGADPDDRRSRYFRLDPLLFIPAVFFVPDYA
jgi:hypothetical protein